MTDVWVTGSSLAALDAALALAEVGLRVRVSVGDSATELPVGLQADPEGAIAAMVARVGAQLPGENAALHPAPQLIAYPPSAVLLRAADGDMHPLSASAVMGIPTAPLATEVSALLGGGGAFRAYLDRLRPVLKVGKERNLGTLVRSRLGAKVEQLLVNPLVRERTGAAAAEIDVAMVAPGLGEAMGRVGSLSGGALAYGDRNVARETTFEPEGGWAALRTALLARLALYSVELVEDQPVLAIGRAADGEGWLVRTGSGDAATDTPVRALIIDVGGDPRLADAHGFADDPALAMQPTRQYVEFGIERPDWLPSPAAAGAVSSTSAAESADEVPAVLELRAAPGQSAESIEGWTARVACRDGAWKVRFSSPRREYGVRVAKPDLAALSLSARVSALPGAVETARSWGAVAPVIVAEADHAREAAITAFGAEHSGMRAVGEGWSGGDFAAGLAESMPRVVELRRALLGLT